MDARDQGGGLLLFDEKDWNACHLILFHPIHS